MVGREDLQLCDGLEKILYHDRCKYCAGNGVYRYEGTNIKLCCDYYEDVFLREFKMPQTQSVPKPKTVPKPKPSDTKATRRLARFEDLPPESG